MVIQGDTDTMPSLDKAFCKLNIFIGRHYAPPRMIMGYYHRDRTHPDRITKYLSRVNQHTICSTAQDIGWITKEMSLHIKIKHKEVLLQIIDHYRTQLPNDRLRCFNRPGI